MQNPEYYEVLEKLKISFEDLPFIDIESLREDPNPKRRKDFSGFLDYHCVQVFMFNLDEWFDNPLSAVIRSHPNIGPEQRAMLVEDLLDWISSDNETEWE